MIHTRRPADSVPLVGQFVRARSKSWIVEDDAWLGHIRVLDLVSVEDDSQGKTLRVGLDAELAAEVIDPNDWSALTSASFEGPDRLGA